jgi:hypothetical protein
LIRRNGRALTGDFGSSRFNNDELTLTGQSTTLYYAGPSLFDEDAELAPNIDVWGLGLILYEIAAGSAVFPISLSPFGVIRQMRRQYRLAIPRECGDYMTDLICRCWSDALSSRSSFGAIVREFQACEFAILPGVDCNEIRSVIDDVLQWEFNACVWQC